MDRPIALPSGLNWERLLWVGIILLAVATRFWDLGSRAQHHDESMHAFYSWELYRGQGYVHNPLLHGPLLYHVTAFVYFLLGASDVTSRVAPAAIGVALVASPLLLRRWLGRPGALAAGTMLAISPGMLYFSRFIRHDIFAILPEMVLFIAAVRYLDERRDRWLYVAAVAMAFLFSSKEVAFITTFLFGLFIWLALAFRHWSDPEGVIPSLRPSEPRGGLIRYWPLVSVPVLALGLGVLLLSPALSRLAVAIMSLAAPGALLFLLLPAVALGRRLMGRSEPETGEGSLQDLAVLVGTLALPLTSGLWLELSGRGPADYTPEGLRAAGSGAVIVAGIIVAGLVGVSVVFGLLWDRRRFLVSLALFSGIFLLLHTTFLTNVAGAVTGLVGSLGYWLSQHDVRRGTQPGYYYFILIPLYEFLPVVLALAGAAVFFLRRRRAPVTANPKAATTSALFVPWLLLWIAGALAIYSWAGEKMPWLSIHMTLPIVLLAGYGFDRIWSATDWRRLALPQSGLMASVMLAAVLVGLGALTAPSSVEGMIDIGSELEALRGRLQQFGFVLLLIGLLVVAFRIGIGMGGKRVVQIAGYSVLGLATLFTVRYAVLASYIHGDVAREILIYTQTSPDVTMVVQEIEDLSERLVGGKEMQVAFDEFTSWPFLWYLRDYPNQQFFGRELFATPEAPVVLVGLENEPAVRPFLTDYVRQQYPLRWWFPEDYRVQEGPGWVGRAIERFVQTFTTPELRSSLMRFLLYRDLERPLGSSDFAFYLRRDVASQLWRSSAVPLTPDLVADPYEEKRIEVTSVLSWGGQGQGEGQFNLPRDIDFDAEGNLYVADSLNHRIQVFDSDGRFLRAWGVSGSGPGEFTEPWGVAVDRGARRIYVADTWNHRIQVFNLHGRFLTQWGYFVDSRDIAGADPLGFFGPRDVAVDANGDVWVADTGNKRIVKFAPDGTPLGQWGGGGPAAGDFQEPVGIAMDASGRIYVADTWNRRIQVFDAEFTPLAQWHLRAWSGEAPANKPFLAVNAGGQVFATDPEGYRVLVLSPQGELLAVFGHFGDDAGAFDVPTGLAVDAGGNLYVADSGNHRVMKFASLSVVD